ncbi:MAG: hypothetical protein QXI16_01255 [Sulfolobaceae archaeon]
MEKFEYFVKLDESGGYTIGLHESYYDLSIVKMIELFDIIRHDLNQRILERVDNNESSHHD